MDNTGALVGILTEGDLLRRAELGTQKRRPRWIEFLIGPNRLARANMSAHADAKVHEVMTTPVQRISEDTSLTDVVRIMESKQVKRLPVMREGRVVGIVSRANLLRALASIPRDDEATPHIYQHINSVPPDCRTQDELGSVALIDVIVRNGVVSLWGTLTEERQRQGIRVAAENTPGVKRVEDHVVWIEPDVRRSLAVGR